MKTGPTCLLSLSLFAVSVAIQAQENNLIRPLSKTETSIAHSGFERSLQEKIYFGKRYRIVEVNADLLFSASPPSTEVTFNLFPDVSFTYTRKSIDTSNNGLSFTWVGTAKNQGLSVDEIQLRNPHIDRDQAIIAHSTLFELQVVGSQHVYDAKRNRSWPVSWLHAHHFDFDGQPIKPKKLDPQSPTFYQVLCEITDPKTGARYRLEPVSMDSRYHVISEIDSDKTFTLPFEPSQKNQSPGSAAIDGVNEQKRQAHRIFLESLGEDTGEQLRQRDFFEFLSTLDNREP